MNWISKSVSALVFGRNEDPLSGNPATVVWCEGQPHEELMAAAAQSYGTPVTAFLTHDGSLSARFFTPTSELPLCGHGLLACGVAEAERLMVNEVKIKSRSGTATVRYTTASGLATLVLPAHGTSRLETNVRQVLSTLGVSEKALKRPEIEVVSVGSPKWLVELTDIETLRALSPRMDQLRAISEREGVNGVYAFSRDRSAVVPQVRARGFNPKGGVEEDAATGIAAAALGWALRAELMNRWITVDQGIRLSNLNRIQVLVTDDEICVGGKVVFVETDAIKQSGNVHGTERDTGNFQEAAMDRTAPGIESDLRRILAQVLPGSGLTVPLGLNDSLQTAGLDSMRTLEVISVLADRFGVELEDDEPLDQYFSTLAGLIALVQNKQNKR